MSRHVVLLTRDTSLAVALRALLGDRARVSELESPKEWRALNGSRVDAVVVDLPPALRKTAVEVLEERFTGPLVVLLDSGEELAKSVNQQRCSVLRRPFGMSELWTLVAAAPEPSRDRPASPAVPPTPAAPASAPPTSPQPASASAPPTSPPVASAPAPALEPEPPAAGPERAVAPPERRAPVLPEPAWRWRLRRFQQAPKPSEVDELTQPMPRVDVDVNGAAPDPGPTPAEAQPEAPAEAPASPTDVVEPAEAPSAEVVEPVVEPAFAAEVVEPAPAAEVEPVPAEVVEPVAEAAPAAEAEPVAAEVVEPASVAEVVEPAGSEVEPVPSHEVEAVAAEVVEPAVSEEVVEAAPAEVAEPVAEAAPAAEAEPVAAEVVEPAASEAEPAPAEVVEPAPEDEAPSDAAAEAEKAVPPAAGVVEGDERLTQVTSAPMWDEASEAPQAVAARLAKRLRLDVVALLLDNGQGLLETAGGVGLSPAERRLQVEYSHAVLRELFRVGVGLIDDTERVRSILGGIPFGKADTLMMVPLAYEGHGFGAVLAGRYRQRPSHRESEFTEPEIEALMDFAEDVAPALRSAILIRRLKSQLNLAEGR